MPDIRQSEQWGNYLSRLGWDNKYLKAGNKNVSIRIKKIPLLGSCIKIQRPDNINKRTLKEIDKIGRKNRAFFIKLEPSLDMPSSTLTTLAHMGYKKDYWPLSASKTIHIILDKPEEILLKSFSKDTRQTLRKVQNLEAACPQNILEIKSYKFYKNKRAAYKALREFHELLRITSKRGKFFAPKFSDLEAKVNAFGKDAYIVLARSNDKPIAGSIVLIHQTIGYYVHAASTKEGQKLRAPYLILWNIIKLCRKEGCKILDLEGIYDPRFKKITKKWKNFSIFKKKWGGKIIEYPGSFTKFYNPLIKLLFMFEKFIP